MKRRDFVALAALTAPAALMAADKTKGFVKKFLCDGRCCHASPLRRPMTSGDHGDHLFRLPDSRVDCDFCVFHDHSMQHDVNSGCRIMADETLLNELTEEEKDRFMKACLAYPHVWYTGDPDGPNDDQCCWGRV